MRYCFVNENLAPFGLIFPFAKTNFNMLKIHFGKLRILYFLYLPKCNIFAAGDSEKLHSNGVFGAKPAKNRQKAKIYISFIFLLF